jgi:hypothetical protein
MKKRLGSMAAYMMAAAMMGAARNPFATDLFVEHRDPHEGETKEERKRRLHKMYGDNSQEHEFIIKGERIMARDKKMAMKIYANRHPEAKSKKRKK